MGKKNNSFSDRQRIRKTIFMKFPRLCGFFRAAKCFVWQPVSRLSNAFRTARLLPDRVCLSEVRGRMSSSILCKYIAGFAQALGKASAKCPFLSRFLAPVKRLLLLLTVKLPYAVSLQGQNPLAASRAVRHRQRKTVFPREICISILVPLYNTPIDFLKEMIDSVRNQTYTGWQLCLADGSDDSHREVRDYCEALAKADSRILYRKLEKNGGISENTNACMDMATGEYIGLFDHDDLLHSSALYEVMKAICEQDADFIYTDEATFLSPNIRNIIHTHYKPDYSPYTLLTKNYICHFSVISARVVRQAGRFRSEYDGSQDHDFILRATRCAEKVVHIPHVLYLWRAHKDSTASGAQAKPYTAIAGQKAVHDYLRDYEGLEAHVTSVDACPTMYRLTWPVEGNPLVSIIIPNKDSVDTLRECIDSVRRSTYRNYEIIIVENNSTEEATFAYYRENPGLQVLTYRGGFNYSAINNLAVRQCRGEYVLLLNNDTKVITPDWLEKMLMFAQRHDVGAVGAKLLYFDDSVQHSGVLLGLGGIAGHKYCGAHRDAVGSYGENILMQEVSAVTAACMMMRKDVCEQVQGLDEGYAVAFNDVDLCMKIRRAGYHIIWTPEAQLYHFESKSRGMEDTPDKLARFVSEEDRFHSRWQKELDRGDPFYNPNRPMNDLFDIVIRPYRG